MSQLNPLPFLVQCLPLWLAVSACVGSFLSVVHWRLPLILRAWSQNIAAPITLSAPRSSCSGCGRPLRMQENLPFLGFGWVKLRHGETPCCRAPLPWRYLAFESAATALGLGAWLVFDSEIYKTLIVSMAGWLLLALVATAFRYRSLLKG